MKKIERQAIILLHGMGEQRPTVTLREFVDGVKWQLEQLDDREKKSVVRNKPDSIGDIYETVRFSMESNFNTKRPKTDFYEFYWAHNMRGTTFNHIVIWLKQVIFRKYRNVPPRLKSVWMTVWAIFLISLTVAGLISWVLSVPLWLKLIITAFGGGILSGMAGMIGSFAKSTLLTSLGDVARYMTPSPDNISERSNIRQQGISFLKKIHSIKNETKPDRIIVVGHSLGSIVSYDLLRLLWTEYNDVYSTPSNSQDQADIINAYAKDPNLINKNPNAFHSAQWNYWNESQELGNPWLITDFITLGAALNSIDYLMVNSVDIEKLKFQREVPTCPPVNDADGNGIFYRKMLPSDTDGNRKGVDVPHHGAMFSMTRWTNIYFTSDFVGGPMQRIFGNGVKDIAISRKSPWFFPGGHTDYWNSKSKNSALKAIVESMGLNVWRL